MGTTAARKAGMILDNAEKVIAIELFAAFQALHMRGEDKLAPATKGRLGRNAQGCGADRGRRCYASSRLNGG